MTYHVLLPLDTDGTPMSPRDGERLVEVEPGVRRHPLGIALENWLRERLAMTEIYPEKAASEPPMPPNTDPVPGPSLFDRIFAIFAIFGLGCGGGMGD